MNQPDPTERPFRDEPTEVLQAALNLANAHAQQSARFRPQQQGDAQPAVADLFQAELQHREGQMLPPPRGPEYTPCRVCSHIEPEHEPDTGPCLVCDCAAYQPVERSAWVDGDPLMEAIAAAIWDHCRIEGTSLVVDDPRNIAAVALGAVATGRAAVYVEVAERLAADAEQGDKDGLTRIYRRSAARQVRAWGEELRRLAGGQPTPDTEGRRKWCKCRSCWGWFVEEHPGEDLDELGKDLRWWSGLPEHRDPPASARPAPSA